MIRFLLGVFVGIVIATIGLSGLASYIDHNIDTLKQVIKEKTNETFHNSKQT